MKEKEKNHHRRQEVLCWLRRVLEVWVPLVGIVSCHVALELEM